MSTVGKEIACISLQAKGWVNRPEGRRARAEVPKGQPQRGQSGCLAATAPGATEVAEGRTWNDVNTPGQCTQLTLSV